MSRVESEAFPLANNLYYRQHPHSVQVGSVVCRGRSVFRSFNPEPTATAISHRGKRRRRWLRVKRNSPHIKPIGPARFVGSRCRRPVPDSATTPFWVGWRDKADSRSRQRSAKMFGEVHILQLRRLRPCCYTHLLVRNFDGTNYARLRAFPPQAVLGPCFSTGSRLQTQPRHARSRACCSTAKRQEAHEWA